MAGADEAALERIGRDAAALAERARQFLQPQSETETELREEIARLEREVATWAGARRVERPAGGRRMSLRDICREAAAEAGVAPPDAVIGGAETVAVRLLAAARQEIFSMFRERGV